MSKFNPPETAKKPVTNEVHGFQITDPYQWLEDKDDPQVRKWSETQHNYTVDYVKENAAEISGLRDEISAYLDRDYTSAPFFRGNRQFITKKIKGEQQSKLYTIIDGKEKLIFDPEKFDPSGKTAISSAAFTKDGSRAGIGTQTSGDEILTVRIIDTKTGKVLEEPITGLNSFGFTADENHAYITVRTREMIDKQVPLKTYRHKISDGDKRDKDVFLIAPDDAKNFASVSDSRYGGLTFYNTGDFYSNKLMVKKTGSKDEPKVIYSSTEYNAQPYVRHGKIWFYTNHEAPNFKLMVTDIDKPEFENWTDFYPEQDTPMSGFAITNDYVIVQYKKDVLSHLAVYDLNGKKVRDLELPEVGDVSGMSYHDETNTIYVGLATFTASSKVYKLDGKTLKWEFFFKDEPPINTDNIESKQVFYTSTDGTKIPMFIVHKKGLKLDGSNPALLYGYGGFNISMTPRFLGTTASFINRGGVYAVANLRGGDEYGEKWHRDGMMFKKQNTFDDFITAGEYLVSEGYTNTDRLACKGGSNGGLLIGAVTTQRPDLWKVAICAVPLLDMVRYHQFLIARYWIPEYGDPDKKEDFLNIIKYSPYHNINSMLNYPTMMVKAGENDTRVDPLHAKKFAAALQNNPGQKNPIILFVDFDSGHGSGQSVEQQIDNIELEWRFVMNELGMK